MQAMKGFRRRQTAVLIRTICRTGGGLSHLPATAEVTYATRRLRLIAPVSARELLTSLVMSHHH